MLRKINKLETAVIVTTYRTAVMDAMTLQRVFSIRQKKLAKQKNEENKNREKSSEQSSDDISSAQGTSDAPDTPDAQNDYPYRECAFDMIVLDEATEIKN